MKTDKDNSDSPKTKRETCSLGDLLCPLLSFHNNDILSHTTIRDLKSREVEGKTIRKTNKTWSGEIDRWQDAPLLLCLPLSGTLSVMPWGGAHGYTLLFSPLTSLPSLNKKAHHLHDSYELSLKNFSHLHVYILCVHTYQKLYTEINHFKVYYNFQNKPSLFPSLHKCWNIHIHTYFFSSFFFPFAEFQKGTFFYTLGFAIFMRSAGSVPKATQWLISRSSSSEEMNLRPHTHTFCSTQIQMHRKCYEWREEVGILWKRRRNTRSQCHKRGKECVSNIKLISLVSLLPTERRICL